MEDCGCTVQGLPLSVFLKNFPNRVNVGSTANGIPVEELIYVAKAPAKKAGSARPNSTSTSQDTASIRCGDRFRKYGNHPEQKPRYKDICRETSRRPA